MNHVRAAALCVLFWAPVSSYAQKCAMTKDNPPACAAAGAACTNAQGDAGNCRDQTYGCACVPKACNDPGGVITLKSDPILSFPATRTFVPLSSLTLTGLSPTPVNTTIGGSMTVLFEAGEPGMIQATIQSLNFSVPSMTTPGGRVSGATAITLHGSQVLNIDQASGATTGAMWTKIVNSLVSLESTSPVVGVMNLATGEWTLSSGNTLYCLRCDINGDNQVNSDDISIILASRNRTALPHDPQDVDGDGLITTNDARICALACTKPMCAK